ncbi:MAG: MFS transporter, partial [Rhodococcus sp. (in: high G+C Gram-positive bacteria)]
VGPAAITVVVDNLGIEWMPLLPAILLALIAIGGPALMRLVPRYHKPASETSRHEVATG